MASLNKVQLIGHLGKDPEIRSTQSGGKIASFSVATSETWKDRTSGERREKVEWHRIVIFHEQTANFTADYLKKGHQVYVEGSLQTRKWQDQVGNDRYSTEIVIGQFNGEMKILGKPNGGSSEERPSRNGSGSDRSTGASTAGWEGSGADLDDEIPF